MRPTLAIAIVNRREADAWLAPLGEALPEAEIRRLDQFAPDAVDYAAAWGAAPGLARCANLKAIVSLGAGIDHILADARLARVPVVRMIDPGLTQGMTEYVVLHVLRHHRREPELEARQRRHLWKPFYTPLASARRVGVLGMGEIGRDAARHLAALGFQVAGWSRRAHRLKGIERFAGANGLAPFLARTEILVCLLPLTPATRGILDARAFGLLPKGASVINAARGGHLIESDLVAALDSGHLSWATLDVFETEPLPASSPLWSHAKVYVSPHNAAISSPDAIARYIADQILGFERGEPLRNVVDRARGY
jgi:glyoxylate/hydroxypyruvate reductase A